MGWGWPSPRLDAARGLPFLALRMEKAEKAVTSALRKLCCDPSDPLRLNLADRLTALERPAPKLMWELLETFIAKERRFTVLAAIVHSLGWLWAREPDRVLQNLQLIARRAIEKAPPSHDIHGTLAHTFLFHFLRTGHSACEAFMGDLIAECDSERAAKALTRQLHACRASGWLTIGDAVTPDSKGDAVRARTWGFFSKLLFCAQAKLQDAREALQQLGSDARPDDEHVRTLIAKRDRTARLVDGIAMQLFFGSGAHDDKNNERITPAQARRFWEEAAPLFSGLATELHPHTAHNIVQTLYHLLPYAPREVFLLATQSIRSSAAAGFQHESLAVGDVVKLIQRALADFRDLFRSDTGQESECLAALLEVLDLFVEAGWAEARQLTHRLEEIYR